MRPLIVYIWLVTTILPTFSQWGTIAYYQINKAYITRVLCANRNKPQLHCNGKCYLAKKLKAQQQKQDQQTSDWVHDIPSLHLYVLSLIPFKFLASHLILFQKAHFNYHMASYQAPMTILVPPPCA